MRAVLQFETLLIVILLANWLMTTDIGQMIGMIGGILIMMYGVAYWVILILASLEKNLEN